MTSPALLMTVPSDIECARVSVGHSPRLSFEYAEEDETLLPAESPLSRLNRGIDRGWIEECLLHLRGPVLRNYRPQIRFFQQIRVPSHLSSAAFAIVLLLIFALVLVSTIRRLLDPDKYQLPWRSYCAVAPEFPPSDLDLSTLPPVGLFIGVMSTAAGYQRRQLIRSTWASHPRSRGGVDGKSGLLGTSRTVVKFIVGAPRPGLEQKLALENEVYRDIVVVPVKENMNEGKTHAYFSWAHEHALVPPVSLEPHAEWVRPDYVIKTDEDSFVMLAELEARLRVELNRARVESPEWDPLVYWGYLIKNAFMGGELYALSWSLVEFVASSQMVQGMTIGPEDQQVAKWIEIHPRASQVRWISERCWIYNHPKAKTVYSHGFLFPSEARRVKDSIVRSRGLEQVRNVATTWEMDYPEYSWSSVTGPSPRYTVPQIPTNLTMPVQIEALIEGSELSWELSTKKPRVHGSPNPPQESGAGPRWQMIQEMYDHRETVGERYLAKNIGGTVVVHYLKRDEWFLETSFAFLGT